MNTISIILGVLIAGNLVFNIALHNWPAACCVVVGLLRVLNGREDSQPLNQQ